VPRSIEEIVFNSQRDEMLRQAVVELPKIQRRRFILYHEFGLSYEQIAEMEGRSLSSVFGSIKAAENKIKEKIKIFSK
jgi:RNA polymerase sigma-70 factor (ECF subfamily)